MLFGFSDDDESDDQRDFILPEACDDLRESVASRRSVSDVFHVDLHNLIGLHDDAVTSNLRANAQVDEFVASPVSVLRKRLCVMPPDFNGLRPRKRLRGKQSMSLAESLLRVQQNPEGECGQLFTHADRKLGFHEWTRTLAQSSGSSIRATVATSRHLWNTTSIHVRNNWTVLAKLRGLTQAALGGSQRRSFARVGYQL